MPIAALRPVLSPTMRVESGMVCNYCGELPRNNALLQPVVAYWQGARSVQGGFRQEEQT